MATLKGHLKNIETDYNHHLAGPFVPGTPDTSETSYTNGNSSRPTQRRKRGLLFDSTSIMSHGLWSDIWTMRWMTVPESSLKLLIIPVILWANWALLAPQQQNPFEYLLFVAYPIPGSSPTLYQKGYGDIAFVLYYIIFWSFVRQSLLYYVFYPLGRAGGITRQSKLDRWGEQNYAVFYFSIMGAWGLSIMSELPTWFYKTEEFWVGYPYWQLTSGLKRYYLMQGAYWTQQLLVMILGLEKPRKDYYELVAHHFVTLWLIFWSYLVNMTYIGNAVFITMDVSDVFLAFAKCCNYLKLERTKTVAFAIFAVVWSYTRHYLNIVMLYSVWTEFDKIPEWTRSWNPPTGAWMAPWMKYQIFVPILLIQLLNIFWYFLIWRILLRALFSSKLDDERSDDEDEGEDPKKTD
jgi:acyl-CoA-dependent ceramide synthase